MSENEIDLQRRRVQEMKGAMERRAMFDGAELELRDDRDAFIVAGYASTFNETYDMGSFRERVAPSAFDRTLSERPDVVFTADHGRSLSGLPLARTRSAKGGPGTLELQTDTHGLAFTARLERDDPDAQALVRAIKSGRMWQSSFAFRVNRDSWDDVTNIRTLQDVSMHHGDVSCVAFPANEGTSVTARNRATAARLRVRIPDGKRERERLALLQVGGPVPTISLRSSWSRSARRSPGWERARIEELREGSL